MKIKLEIRKLICLILLLLNDILAFFSAFLVAYLIRNKIFIQLFHFQLKPFTFSSQLKSGFIVGALIILAIFSFEKLYIRRFSIWEETRHLLKGITLSFILLMIIAFIPGTFQQFSRIVILLTWLASLIFFPLFRLSMKKLFNKLGLWKKNVLILGTNPAAQLVAQEIRMNNTLCYQVIGFLTEERKTSKEKFPDEAKIVGKISDLNKDLCQKLEVKDIFIALPHYPQNKLIQIAKNCETLAETIKIVPNISSLYALGVEIENVGDIISVSVARNLAKPWNIFIKKTFEFLLALFLFLTFLPAYLIIALSIKLDSPGPVIFSQDRLGRKDKSFRILKFRSMYMDGDKKLQSYLKQNPLAKEEWQKYKKLKKDDPRLTKVGRFIRRWSLDELPQLVNVLKGEMSLVGPRPYLPQEKRRIKEIYRIISSVTPGLTGLWQVHGRNILTFKDRVLLDDYYIRNWSLWLDIIILLKTIKALLKRQGAY